MKDADETGNKVFRLIELVEHFQKETANSLKQAVKERTVVKKKWTEIFINGKDQMSVRAAKQFKNLL
ncbi:MAG: hypothetical protein RSC13_09735 [Clostridium sp.]